MNGQLYELAKIYQAEQRREAQRPMWIEQLGLTRAFSRRVRPLLGSELARLGRWVGGAALRETAYREQEAGAHDPARPTTA
ncbi:MAG TPA: hypothetical protein VFI42_04970 [Thermomicrobiaceae bacterium]|nr:hypothetical protein [Thermomicrobiaceae bacterium]